MSLLYLGSAVENAINWLSINLDTFFGGITWLVNGMVETFQEVLLAPPSVIVALLISFLAYYASAKSSGLFTKAGWKAGRFLFLFTFIGLMFLSRDELNVIVANAVLKFDYWYIIGALLTIGIPAAFYYKKTQKYGVFKKSGFAEAGVKSIVYFVILLALLIFINKSAISIIVLEDSYWEETMLTFALVVTSAILALVIGIPIGIWAAKSDAVEETVRPALDFMQTMPPFVYLIPAILFFSVGNVPGVVATVVFALPPGVRFTSLGIRNVQPDVVEAAWSFGASNRQLLYKVQLPLAKPTILAGINQVIMLSLSMVVIASMVGAAGLGQAVYKGILTANIALGFEAGMGIVVVAIILDRITQALGDSAKKVEEE